MLNIQGLQKTTLLDYPGCVAATVFLGGCNMRCPFCHNMDIVTTTGGGAFTEEDILKFLAKRQGLLDGVCITGGEPTLYKELPELIGKIRDTGYKVKLDTNGTNPQMLEYLTKNALVDYVAMDIKSSLSGYEKACGIHDIDLSPIKESICLLTGGDTDYEFRTTAVEEFLDSRSISDIGTLLRGARRYFLQGYVESEFVPDKSLHAVPKEKLLQYVQELSKYIDHVEIRGID
ncbi:MAG: anaerobic ribonucleoside-triphosphate reductase activating protein [Lachnospiraceae bacterium]|nr:anaerobic ribonucleoside-triphosphate reductase activating protein [Lachnospiraceae bacterium]